MPEPAIVPPPQALLPVRVSVPVPLICPEFRARSESENGLLMVTVPPVTQNPPPLPPHVPPVIVNVDPTPKLIAAGETASSVPALLPARSVSIPPFALTRPEALLVSVGATLELPEFWNVPLLTMLVPPPLCRKAELSVMLISAPLWFAID